MSYAVARPPADQTTTSTIYEFICLFTHDLKRKTKRWQDGRLKYHLFNNRIMVYDDRGGNVGDAHWTANMSSSGSEYLEEGDEFDLDRGAAIVQVCERVGCKEVDLRELVDKRAREVEKRRVEAAGRSTQANRGVNTPNPSGNRALSSMFTPGRIGRAAVPRESPFEQRMRREQQQDGPPPAKRVRREPSPPSRSTHARALFGTQLTLSTPGGSGSWGRSQVLRDRTNVRAQVSSSLEEEEEAKKESERAGKRVRESSPDEQGTHRRPIIGSTSSRLGGLRIERSEAEERSQATQSESNIRQPAARPSTRHVSPTTTVQSLDEDDKPSDYESTPAAAKRPKVASRSHQVQTKVREPTKRRLAPPVSSPLFVDDDEPQPSHRSPPAAKKSGGSRSANAPQPQKAESSSRASTKQPPARSAPQASSPQDLTMDDDPLPHEPESPPVARKSQPMKPAAASRPEKTTAKRHKPVLEQTAHVAPRSKQPSLPPPAVPSRSKPQSDSPAENAATRVADRKEERRTELRIKKGKKRGLLMLAQPEALDEVREKVPSPEPKKNDKGADAGFMAWLDDDDDLEPDVTQRAQHRKEKRTDPEPDVDAQRMDDKLSDSASKRVDDERCEAAVEDNHHHNPSAQPSQAQERQPPIEEGHSGASPNDDANDVSQPRSISPEAESRMEEPIGLQANNSPPPRALRSKKRIAKPAITIPVSSQTSPAAAAEEPEPEYMQSSASESDSELESMPPRRTRSSRSKQTSTNESDTRNQISTSTADSSSVKNPKDPANAKKKKGSESGITVSRINRSCKSKVITGYVERDTSAVPSTGNYLLPGGWGSAAAMLAAEVKLNDEAGSELERQTVEPDTGRSTAEAQNEGEEANIKKTRQISNPATRGRKAASKADAAGGILQVSVPFDEPVPRPRVVLSASTRGGGAIISGGETSSSANSPGVITTRKPGVGEKKDLPVFAKANGGAWSRHAGDLLGMGRPEEKRRR